MSIRAAMEKYGVQKLRDLRSARREAAFKRYPKEKEKYEAAKAARGEK